MFPKNETGENSSVQATNRKYMSDILKSTKT